MALYAAAAVLFVLHQDFWLWGNGTLVLGAIPAGLLYHLVYCLAASALLLALVRFAWPGHLDDETGAERPARDASWR